MKITLILFIIILLIINIFPNNQTEEFYSIVRQYYEKEDYNGALNQLNYFLQKYPQSPVEINVLHTIAATYEKLENYEKAIETYQEIIEKYTGTQHERIALSNIAYLQYTILKNYNEAYKTYLILYEKYKNTQYVRIYLEKIISLCDLLKNYAKGIDFIKEIITRYPTHTSNYNIYIPLKINFKIKLNRIDHALNNSLELINFFNENPGNIVRNISRRKEELYLIIANLYFIKKDYDNSINYYKKAIEISSSLYNTGEYLLKLSEVYIKSNNPSKAIQYFENALKKYSFPENFVDKIKIIIERLKK